MSIVRSVQLVTCEHRLASEGVSRIEMDVFVGVVYVNLRSCV